MVEPFDSGVKYRCKWLVLVWVITASLLGTLFPTCSEGASLLYLKGKGIEAEVNKKLETACHLLGLNLETIKLGDMELQGLLPGMVSGDRVRAVLVDRAIFNKLTPEEFWVAMSKIGVNAPVLIMGLDRDASPVLLKEWTKGAVIGIEKRSGIGGKGFYRFSGPRELCSEFSGQDIALESDGSRLSLVLANESFVKAESVVEYCPGGDGACAPVLAKFRWREQDIFLEAALVSGRNYAETGNMGETLLDMAVLLIFLKYAFGVSAWHGSSDFANLTIDDPWLVEPYGNLSYAGLVEHAKRENFHTTIGFIPWNYDRSEPKVVELLNRNLDRISLSVHGNDHDHKEFERYLGKSGEERNFTLSMEYSEKLRTALARMDELSRLTRLPYDKVMIFPYAIGSEGVLELLKRHGFLATVNGPHIPLGASIPREDPRWMRSVLTDFAGFPSFRRAPVYPKLASRQQIQILLDLLLDNPVIFGSHHDLFAEGMGAFDGVARFINRAQPQTKWVSLAEIARRWYLKRLRVDGDYDVIASSGEIIIENLEAQDRRYWVRKQEPLLPLVVSVNVDRKPIEFQRDGDWITFRVDVPARESRVVELVYDANQSAGPVDISKRNLRVLILRSLSDFRDMVLGRTEVGRLTVSIYYRTGLFRHPLLLSAIFLLIGPTMFFLLYLRKRKKTPKGYPNNRQDRTA